VTIITIATASTTAAASSSTSTIIIAMNSSTAYSVGVTILSEDIICGFSAIVDTACVAIMESFDGLARLPETSRPIFSSYLFEDWRTQTHLPHTIFRACEAASAASTSASATTLRWLGRSCLRSIALPRATARLFCYFWRWRWLSVRILIAGIAWNDDQNVAQREWLQLSMYRVAQTNSLGEMG
jgi:hypothetical protein